MSTDNLENPIQVEDPKVIKLGRFDTQLPKMDLGEYGLRRWRVGSERPSRREEQKDVIPVVVQDGQIGYLGSDGSITTWVSCSEYVPGSGQEFLLVLNNRELWPLRSLIQRRGSVNIICMEAVLGDEIDWDPIPEQRAALLTSISKILSDVFEINLKKHNTVFDAFNLKMRARAERKVPWARKFDRLFFHAQFPGYSEAFRFLENRPGRSVVLLDFNSMFPYGTLGSNFADPDGLEYCDHPGTIEDHLRSENPNGLFHVRMKKRSDTPGWFSEMHPFRLVQQNVGSTWRWDDQVLEHFLHGNEVNFFRRWIDIDVLEGVYSCISIEHPLAPTSKKLYEFRCSEKDPWIKSIWKKYLLAVHGSLNAHHRTGRWIPYHKINTFFWQNFASRPFHTDSVYAEAKDQNNTHVRMGFYRVDHPRNVYSLMSQTLANSRVKLFEFLGQIHEHEPELQAEICYCNIDSVHLSLPASNRLKLDEFLRSGSWFGPELGKLKIEAEGDSGLWMDVGRYWIFKNDLPVYFRGAPSEINPFKFKKTYTRITLPSGENNTWRYKTMNGVSYWKTFTRTEDPKLIEYKRKSFQYLEGVDQAESAHIEETASSLRAKLSIFNRKKRAARAAGFFVSKDGKEVVRAGSEFTHSKSLSSDTEQEKMGLNSADSDAGFAEELRARTRQNKSISSDISNLGSESPEDDDS